MIDTQETSRTYSNGTVQKRRRASLLERLDVGGWWIIPAVIGGALLWPPLIRGTAYLIQKLGEML